MEGTDVTFTCTVDANPDPAVSLMFRNTDGETPISQQSVTGPSLTVVLSMQRDYNDGEFFCRTVGEDPSYILDSSTISFNVNC